MSLAASQSSLDLDDPNVDVVARTIYGEARGQGLIGMQAVANVIANRVRNPRWWGRNWVEVCTKKWMFSCWLEGDPNREKLLKVDARSSEFRKAIRIAKAAIAGTLEDVTKNSDHYLNAKIAAPKWTRGRKPVKTIRDHTFYRLELSAPK